MLSIYFCFHVSFICMHQLVSDLYNNHLIYCLLFSEELHYTAAQTPTPSKVFVERIVI